MEVEKKKVLYNSISDALEGRRDENLWTVYWQTFPESTFLSHEAHFHVITLLSQTCVHFETLSCDVLRSRNCDFVSLCVCLSPWYEYNGALYLFNDAGYSAAITSRWLTYYE